MSDYFHEQMVGKMKLEVTVPIDNNTTFPVKILTEGKAKEMILNALEDVRAKIEALYVGDVCAKEHNCDKDVLDIIDRKITEVKGDKE